MSYQMLNGSNLSYIGDAYYELRVRKHLIDKGITKNTELRKISIMYVSASAHKLIFEKIKDELTQEEINVFNRGRNGAPKGYRKNVDRGAYVISSGIEAVIGYLYLKEDFNRLDELIAKMFLAVEGE